jgi:thymidylate synthase
MIVFTAASAETLFLKGLVECKNGVLVTPRGLHTIEARGPVCFELTNPKRCLVTNPYRKLNYVFGLFESIAMWNGINNVETFKFYNKEMEKFSDDGYTFYGSYGEEFLAQVPHTIKLLQNDRDTRQAVITIWKKNPHELSKDIPCTVMLHFMIRDFHLNLTVYMRSNDIWLGFPYDITNFSRIQQAMAATIDMEIGVLRHIAGSLHMYNTDIYKAEWALKYQGDTIDIPLASGLDLRLLEDTAKRCRKGLDVLQPTTDFGIMHTDLLWTHGQYKLLGNKYDYPEPYKSLISRGKEVHGHFKDSKNPS